MAGDDQGSSSTVTMDARPFPALEDRSFSQDKVLKRNVIDQIKSVSGPNSRAQRTGSVNSSTSDDQNSREVDPNDHETNAGKRREHKCCYLSLKPGVTKFMVFSFILGYFSVTIQKQIMGGFTSYLLEDRHGLKDAEAAKTLGNLGLTSDLCSIGFNLILGSLMDLIGRKLISVVFLGISGVTVTAIPFPTGMGGVYACRIINSIGLLPLSWSPYGVDYIKKESQGILGAYMVIAAHIGGIMTNSMAIQIEEHVGVVYVYLLFGTIVLLCTLITSFGLKDVLDLNKVHTKKANQPLENQNDEDDDPLLDDFSE